MPRPSIRTSHGGDHTLQSSISCLPPSCGLARSAAVRRTFDHEFGSELVRGAPHWTTLVAHDRGRRRPRFGVCRDCLAPWRRHIACRVTPHRPPLTRAGARCAAGRRGAPYRRVSRGAASRTASFVTGGRRASVSVLTAVGHIEARYLAHDDPNRRPIGRRPVSSLATSTAVSRSCARRLLARQSAPSSGATCPPRW
jgi:hypothetical protein